MNKIIASIFGVFLSIFILISLGGKEFKNTTDRLEPLHIDKLMPPNERVYAYMEQYSKEYQIPMVYILRCARIESNYKGMEHTLFAPYEDWLVSTANALGVLQVRVIAAREAWRQYGYKSKHIITPRHWSQEWFEEKQREYKYKLRYRLPLDTELKYKTNAELAYLLRYDLQFNVETGIRYMRFLYDDYKNYTTVYSVYNQGMKGKYNINAYARYITKVKV